MKLLGTIQNWLGRQNDTVPVAKREYSPAEAWLQGRETWSPEPRLLNAMRQSVWVYACVTAIGEQVADIPFVFSRGRRGGEDRVDAGPVVELFNQPGPLIDRFMFWNLACQWLLLRGKCYMVALDRDGFVIPLRPGALPARLAFLNPDRMRVVRQGREFLGYHYEAAPGDEMENRNFLPDEIIHLRMPYAYDYLEGLPPLGVALLAAETDYLSSLLMKGLVVNNADAGLIVTTENMMTSEQQAQIRAALNDRKRAAGTADRPLFLHDKCVVQTPPLALADMQFLESRKFNRQEICAVFRVPQEVLGYTEDANRSVSEAMRLSFIENRIVPFCRRLESALEPVVKLFGADLWGWFDWECLPVMQAARRLRYATAREGFRMGVPLNVLNQVFDLGLPPETTKDTNNTNSRGRRGEALSRLEELLGDMANGKWQMANGEWKSRAVKGLEGKFSRFFFEQRARTLSRMQNGGSLFDLRSEDQYLVEALGPVLSGLLEECVREMRTDCPNFELEAGERAAFMEEREVALREVNTETAEALKTRISRIETKEATARAVKGVFQGASDWRARELAEREVSLAWGFVRNLRALGEETKNCKS
jgi:HK97 family phage portal protein